MPILSAIFTSIRKFLVPIHKEGTLFILAAVVIAVLLDWITPRIGWVFWFIPLFVTYFFRDPPRVTPLRDGLVVAPADGKVTDISAAVPPPELEMGDQPMLRVSIFLSVFDVHINRVPVGGTIRKVVYTPGLFLNADLDKASVDNERNAIVVEGAYGPVACIQIAGLIARRILCFVRAGDTVSPGSRFGLIRFGSRTDVFIPGDVKALVAVGQRAIGGETILADLAATEPQRQYKVA